MNQNYYNLSLKDISYLLALAEYLHFSKAAEAVLVSQPALSKQIKEIEVTLDTKIFERNKKQVRITPKGEKIIKQARVVADEAKKLFFQASKNDKPLTGELRLGIIASSGPYLIPKILKPLKKKYPELKLFIHEGYTDELLLLLKKSELDLVIAADTFHDEVIEKMNLFFEPFILVTSSNHPMATRKSASENDIKPDEMILLEEGNCLSDQTWALCPTRNSQEKSLYQATSLETLYHMVAAEIGYSLVPAFSKSKDPSVNNLLKYIPFRKKDIGRQMIIVSRKTYHSRENLELLADLIISCI